MYKTYSLKYFKYKIFRNILITNIIFVALNWRKLVLIQQDSPQENDEIETKFRDKK